MNTQAKTMEFSRKISPRTNVDVADGGLLVILVEVAEVGVGKALERLDERGSGFKFGLVKRAQSRTTIRNREIHVSRCNSDQPQFDDPESRAIRTKTRRART
jgi:hypothetical protein